MRGRRIIAKLPATTAKTIIASAGVQTVLRPPPRRSPRPRRNQACGVRSVNVLSTPGAWETGKNVPPSSPRTIATMVCQLPACSCVLASVATRAMTPIAARTAAITSTPTPTGLPHDAPKSRVVATTRTPMLTTPMMRLVSSLPPRIADRAMGAAAGRARDDGGDGEPDPVELRGVGLSDRAGDLGRDRRAGVADHLYGRFPVGLHGGREAGRDDERGAERPLGHQGTGERPVGFGVHGDEAALGDPAEHVVHKHLGGAPTV